MQSARISNALAIDAIRASSGALDTDCTGRIRVVDGAVPQGFSHATCCGCGAPVDAQVCRYCGRQHVVSHEPGRIATTNPVPADVVQYNPDSDSAEAIREVPRPAYPAVMEIRR